MTQDVFAFRYSEVKSVTIDEFLQKTYPEYIQDADDTAAVGIPRRTTMIRIGISSLQQ